MRSQDKLLAQTQERKTDGYREYNSPEQKPTNRNLCGSQAPSRET